MWKGKPGSGGSHCECLALTDKKPSGFYFRPGRVTIPKNSFDTRRLDSSLTPSPVCRGFRRSHESIFTSPRGDREGQLAPFFQMGKLRQRQGRVTCPKVCGRIGTDSRSPVSQCLTPKIPSVLFTKSPVSYSQDYPHSLYLWDVLGPHFHCI